MERGDEEDGPEKDRQTLSRADVREVSKAQVTTMQCESRRSALKNAPECKKLFVNVQ